MVNTLPFKKTIFEQLLTKSTSALTDYASLVIPISHFLKHLPDKASDLGYEDAKEWVKKGFLYTWSKLQVEMPHI